MAHFFQPTHRSAADAGTAASGAAISALVVRPGAAVKVGLWGVPQHPLPTDIWAFRAGNRANGLPSSPVKVVRLTGDAKQQFHVYSVSGLREGDFLIAVLGGQPLTDELPVHELRNTPSGIMREAANAYEAGAQPQMAGICPFAVPYLVLRHATMGGMTVLRDSAAGGPLLSVHGLAMHTTAGTEARSPYLMAKWGCVEVWNKRGVSAHFGVAGNGTLVQFLPVNFVAYAQYSPGNEHWISVEVDNDGKSMMNSQQFGAVQSLFRWVANRYGIPFQLATGCLFPKNSHFDDTTTKVCSWAGATTTTDPYVACMSRGLSCHWWLEANKNNNSHACPGPGILKQLHNVVGR